jgi:glutaconate CoA-transferase subunit B
MQVLSLHPGVTIEQVGEATGFKLGVDEQLSRTEPPTEKELTILRNEVDPRRYILGRPC